MGLTNSVADKTDERGDSEELANRETKHGDLNTRFRPSLMPNRKPFEFDSLSAEAKSQQTPSKGSHVNFLERDSASSQQNHLRFMHFKYASVDVETIKKELQRPTARIRL